MTTTVTEVPSSATTVVLLAANAKRKHASVFNAAEDEPLYVKLGPGAADDDFTVRVAPGALYEVPTWPDNNSRSSAPQTYTGVISGVWEAADASGGAQATEIV